MTRDQLIKKARKVWLKYRGTGRRPTGKEQSILSLAYWSRALPKDPDYSVAQWVEDILQ